MRKTQTYLAMFTLGLLQSALVARSSRDLWKQAEEQARWEHTRDVLAVAFSGDSSPAMSVSSDGELKRWSAGQSTAKTTVTMRARFVSAAFSRTGILALARPLDEGASVLVINLAGEQLAQSSSKTSSIVSMIFSFDGRLVIAARENGLINIASSNTGKDVATLGTRGFAMRRLSAKLWIAVLWGI